MKIFLILSLAVMLSGCCCCHSGRKLKNIDSIIGHKFITINYDPITKKLVPVELP